MAITSPSSFSLGPSHCYSCQTEGFCCSMSTGGFSGRTKHSPDGLRGSDCANSRHPFFGQVHCQSLPTGLDHCLLKVRVPADYSDSAPDSSDYIGNQQYHPLEEVKAYKRSKHTELTSAEIARTIVEANSSALLVFPGMVHCEPHERVSWSEFQYIIDDYGDIFFEIFDDENILQDRGASNPVNAFIGMDIPLYENRWTAGAYNMTDHWSSDDFSFNNYQFEILDHEVSDSPVEWGMPDDFHGIHPVYFAKYLTKAANVKHIEKMDRPSNGLSIVGYLRPAFDDEESYLRSIFPCDDGNGYISDWKDSDMTSFDSQADGVNSDSTFYKLEIMRIDLFSVYGVQSAINLHDFQDAEPDVLAHSASAIVKCYGEKGRRCKVALTALCKKKGLNVEGANLIGVDSLGMDLRLFRGVEAQTLRVPFKNRATSVGAAEKQIQQLLFPRSHRKKFRIPSDKLRDLDPF